MGQVRFAGLAYSGTEYFEYRYAELLLNIAECYAAKGDIGNAVNYLGKIRARVGIPAANNYGIGSLSSKYAALEACLYERRVELAYEGKRFGMHNVGCYTMMMLLPEIILVPNWE